MRARRIASLVMSSALLLVAMTGTASAVPETTTTKPMRVQGQSQQPKGTTTTTSPYQAALNDMSPLSLTAALLYAQADKSGVTLDVLLAQRAGDLDKMLGSSWKTGGLTFDSLNKALSSRTFGSLSDPSNLTSSLSASAGTPDGMAVMSGIDMARRLAGLSSGSLQMPSIAGAHPDELAVGLFANQSLAAFASGFPDLFGQVGASGAFSAEGMAGFQASMQAAQGRLSGGLSAALPSPCYAGMMMAMASGSSEGASAIGVPSDCGSCLAAGSYMHGRMTDLMTPNTFSQNSGDGYISGFEWGNLDAGSQQAILSLNPELANQMNQVQSGSTGVQAGNATACSQASAGTTNFMTNGLSGVLGGLGF